MSKIIKLLITVFAVAIIFCIIIMYQGVNPKLSSIEVVEENEVGVYVSPDGEIVAPSVKEVRWINKKMIIVNGTEIAIDATYDFRKN